MPHLLDERLEWHEGAWRYGGPWRLGHGLTHVGPGWWPIVRRGFATVAERPGIEVYMVKSHESLLVFYAAHGDDPLWAGAVQKLAEGGWAFRPDTRNSMWEGLQPIVVALRAELREASRTVCEACGAAVPPVPATGRPGRNHCDPCAARHAELCAERRPPGSPPPHVRLWEERSGVTWPRWG